MKRIILTLLVGLMMASTAKASHVYGGEITWRCLANGQYIFYMSIYRDCTGATWSYTTATLQIFGNPLPKSATNSTVNSILVKPDSNRWLANRNGDTSPQCDPSSPKDGLSCANADPGTVQAFYYKSDALTLRGVPPITGWRFVFTPPCCRPSVTNLSSGATPIYRAIMYRDKKGTNVDPCIDSSPEFKALPVSLICRYYTFTYNNTVFDADLDSVVFAWDRTYDTPASNPSTVNYTSGYNYNNPTPGKAFNNQNIPSTLDPVTGIIKLAVYSGGPQTKKYLTVVRADSYRDGKVIASVFREIPFVFFDCNPLPKGPGGQGGGRNNPPKIEIDGVPAEDTIADIVAGQTISIPFQATDNDYGGLGNGGLQRVTTIPNGFMFSQDLIDTAFCYTNSVAPCAILQNQTPTLNNIVSPPRREISGLGGIATEFIWAVKCYHIRSVGTGVPGQQFGIYNFVMRTMDDHCPLPAINYPTITVRVRDPLPLTEPIMKGASVELDGRLIYQWVPPIDTAFTFNSYVVEFSTVADNQPPSLYQTLNPNLKRYKSRYRNGAFVFHYNNPFNKPDVLNKIPGKDWYFRMTTRSGCAKDVPSTPAEPVQVIELKTTPVGQAPDPARSMVRIDWNSPKPQFSKSYPYFVYESNTHYYIWENDSIDKAGVYLGGEQVESNWYLRGDTNATTYSLSTNTCNAKVGFRVEARDTVITWVQGSGPGTDSTDTLTFRTFSIIDTMQMIDRGYVNPPQFDSIIVMENGDVYFRIDRANAGPVSHFRINDESTNPPTQIASFKSEVDSFLFTGINANNIKGKFSVSSVDECDPNRTARSLIYNTILPTGKLKDPECAATFGLNWNKPSGFTSAISRYEVYVNKAGAGYVLDQVITNNNDTSADITNIATNTTYKFKVVAKDQRGKYNSSAILIYQSPLSLRTFEKVPAPEIACTYVEDDGTVTLTFIPPRDSTDNGVSYEFEYQESASNNWTKFTGSSSVNYNTDTTVLITGINALNKKYDFRTRTISGCSGTEPSDDYSKIVSTIEVMAMADYGDKDKPVVLSWNDNQAVGNGDYTIFRSVGTAATNPFFAGTQLGTSPTTGYIDLFNATICDTINGYYVTTENSMANCISRSSYDTANVKDVNKPGTQYIDMVTVNPQTEELEIYWSKKTDADIDSIYFFQNVGQPGSNQLIRLGGVSWYDSPSRFVVPLNKLDTRDTSYFITAQAVDGCSNVDDDYKNFDYHRNIDVDVKWNMCDSLLELTWNGYYYFNDGNKPVSYTVYVEQGAGNGFSEIVSSTTLDSSYNYKVIQGDMNYRFYIKAINSTNTLAANSNIDADSAFYQDEPLYGYLHYATVLPNNSIEVQMLKDVVVRQGSYNLFRGTVGDLSQMSRVSQMNGDAVYPKNTFKFEDFGADPTARSYYYKVVTKNPCGGDVDTTNFARTIHLSVTPDNEALTNNLMWNEYTEWDSTVAYYNVYRGFNGGAADKLIATVAPAPLGYNTYVDNVYDHSLVKGKYCYKVEAVQGPIATEYQPMIKSATSMSNQACATQQPLFYVPNAFAPDGFNKTFKPEGQFLDFSQFEMVIYNRWGEKLFETRDINVGWDGTNDGELVPLGSYIYTIRFKDGNDEQHNRKGSVTVIR